MLAKLPTIKPIRSAPRASLNVPFLSPTRRHSGRVRASRTAPIAPGGSRLKRKAPGLLQVSRDRWITRGRLRSAGSAAVPHVLSVIGHNAGLSHVLQVIARSVAASYVL
jgi:hypothetical protein